MKIVIVDDEADIGFIIGIELQNLGHETRTFLSALDAKNYLSTQTADAIICDFQMPRMSGMELLKWLQDEGKDIPFYILTGEPNTNTEELLNSGVKEILFKPGDLLRLPAIFS